MTKTITNYLIATIIGACLAFYFTHDIKWFNLVGTWLIEASQQLIPTLNAVIYLLAGALIYKWGGER